MNYTKLMKVARIYDFGDIRIEETPIPQIGPKEALVQVKACGICSGDVTPWYIKRKAPIVLGHEPAGIIVEVGNEISEFSVGDRVFVHHHAPCFKCRHCENGDYVQCTTWKKSHIIPGGIAEYFLVPEINLRGDTLKLPESVSFEDAALTEPTACSVKAIKRARLRSTDTVLIIGLGIMGQINVLLAKHYGAKKILVTDFVEYRRNKALGFGADIAINPSQEDLVEQVSKFTNGEMADVVIVGPGSTSVMDLGIRCAGKGGTVVFFMGSPPEETLTLSPFHLYFNEISLVCSYSCGPDDTKEALKLIQEGIVNSTKLVTHRFAIEETSQAFEKMAEAQDILKALVTF